MFSSIISKLKNTKKSTNLKNNNSAKENFNYSLKLNYRPPNNGSQNKKSLPLNYKTFNSNTVLKNNYNNTSNQNKYKNNKTYTKKMIYHKDSIIVSNSNSFYNNDLDVDIYDDLTNKFKSRKSHTYFYD